MEVAQADNVGLASQAKIRADKPCDHCGLPVGMYPVGTVIVKHSHTTGFDEYTAMVKRGNDFK